ncbi:hypothetical protein [Shewanella glacialipiscicola]|uniref:hypothetical protein n=1 Tax=Shewanella glacialipiscicola TaxID=614069 RepID=UPI003D7B68CA
MAFETISLGSQPAGTGGDTARTAFEKVNRNFLAADVLAAAMSQAQFDANRNANKELYAASGWVNFGNHESGKQVNECKSGLYTAITTPNTLLIGKSGGVGGSKTDYASVNIDGVVFNLTNQFVLTLPSHPTSVLPERMDMYGVESEKVEISSASPNAYQGGLRGVGAAVNLFSATEQQKKDFFAQNSNTTYIGSDGKIYQWQLYRVSFAGATGGVPSPTEQGYSLNSFGDLWLKAGKNLLYFGNTLRLNDGGYHPSFNPLGAAKFVGDTFWYNTATSITSKADCFNPSKLHAGSGSIASGKSGRPEIGGRYYDAIYANGHGGICRDMRYSAYSVTTEDFFKAELAVESGEYRGFQRLVYTKVYRATITLVGQYAGGRYIRTDLGDIRGVADKRYSMFYNKTRGVLGYLAAVEEINTYLSLSKTVQKLPNPNQVGVGEDGGIDIEPYTESQVGDVIYFIGTAELPSSVGDVFLQTDIIADPEVILATPAIANGWEGRWGGLPTAGGAVKKGSRKLVNAGILTYSADSGVAWDTASTGLPNSGNIITSTYSTYEIRMCQYYARALQAENVTVPLDFLGVVSIHPTAVVSMFPSGYGVFLGESLINKVATDSPTLDRVSACTPAMLEYCTTDTGALYGGHADYSIGVNRHSVISLSASTSSAFKAIRYNVSVNQQGFIQYAYAELKYNGTNWGDAGTFDIETLAIATRTDLNGNTVLVGNAKLKEPLGWIKNTL